MELYIKPGSNPHDNIHRSCSTASTLQEARSSWFIVPRRVLASHATGKRDADTVHLPMKCQIVTQPAVQDKAEGAAPWPSNGLALPSHNHCCAADVATAAACLSAGRLVLALPAALPPSPDQRCPNYSDILISTPSNSLTCS